VKATEVTAGLAESNGSLLAGLWRDSLHVTCGLTACTPGSAPGPTLGNEYGKTLPLPYPPLEGSGAEPLPLKGFPALRGAKWPLLELVGGQVLGAMTFLPPPVP